MDMKTGRNDPCPCGSGKKYKRCHLLIDEQAKKSSKTDTGSSAGGTSPGSAGPGMRKSFGMSKDMLLPLARTAKMYHDDPGELERMCSALNLPDDTISGFKDFISSLWDLDKVKKMSTEEIVGKLRSMKIGFDEDTFKKQAQGYFSACKLAEDHYYPPGHRAFGMDDDFVWMAIIVLWERLMPERYNVEMIDDLMQDGYAATEVGDYRAGIGKWEKVWAMVKAVIPPDIKSVEGADEYIGLSMSQSIYNWCQDFEMELGNAAAEEETERKDGGRGRREEKRDGADMPASFHAMRIKYCHDFCTVFPQSDKRIMVNMYRAEAESYAAMGDVENADRLFRALTEEKLPGNAWGYISWGDIYCHPEWYPRVPVNYDRAEEIYRLGLARCSSERDDITGRLDELAKMKSGSAGTGGSISAAK